MIKFLLDSTNLHMSLYGIGRGDIRDFLINTFDGEGPDIPMSRAIQRAFWTAYTEDLA